MKRTDYSNSKSNDSLDLNDLLCGRGVKKRELTEREKEVLLLIIEGLNNSEIANRLFITPHTAKAHVSSILYKLDVDSRLRAAIKAVRENIVN